MTPDFSDFLFGPSAAEFDQRNDFVAIVRAGINNRAQLFEALQRELRFPDYFGNNWDALLDCLRDFAWITERRVVIVHEDVPHLDPKAIRIYLEILSQAVQDWRTDAQHELIVVFPRDCRKALEEMASR